jgi:hypothetical protein
MSTIAQIVTEAFDADLNGFIMREHSNRPTNEHLADIAVAVVREQIALAIEAAPVPDAPELPSKALATAWHVGATLQRDRDANVTRETS